MPVVKKQTTKAMKKGGGVLSRIAPIRLTDVGVKMNVYGRSGTGKTTFACTFPKPLLLIGAEDGTRSVHNVDGVDFVRLRESGELTDLVVYARDNYKTTVLDTASSLQDMVLKEILGIDELPAQRNWGMAKQQQWGQCALETKERLRSLLDLPCNVVIVAQEREFNTDSESDLLIPYVASALTPSVVGWLNPACDYICQTLIRQRMVTKRTKLKGKVIETQQPGKGVEYCVRVAPSAVYTTKFRAPKGFTLPEMLVDPDYETVQRLITEGG